MTCGTRTIRAPRGTTISCKGWQQEAALRMLMNNLDPEVAERPEDLVVYGGSGRAARDWASFDAIVSVLTTLGDDETLVVAVELLCACEALDLLSPLTTSTPLSAVHAQVRTRVARRSGDRPPSPDIEAIAVMIASGALDHIVGPLVN